MTYFSTHVYTHTHPTFTFRGKKIRLFPVTTLSASCMEFLVRIIVGGYGARAHVTCVPLSFAHACIFGAATHGRVYIKTPNSQAQKSRTQLERETRRLQARCSPSALKPLRGASRDSLLYDP